ncbi:thiol:disulfide interchange protein TlpA [Agaricicola taiwanensis]|uniref:Thiol:disulfide interchange protein TlpA n=2 Tax=Agaricicola taiwanensis TaxID=591372 RepID=A0A8J3DZC1_9RHOB|nr:thiol:disulfide interchange protein TlpA [Agaricicola taiwanensis]
MLLAATAGLVAGTALAVFYGISGVAGNKDTAACTASRESLAKLQPLVKGEIAALVISDEPRPLPDLAFLDGEGQPKKLSDFRGRMVALNLWATWCAPCREEMPAFDKLQGEMQDRPFDVVAVSIDSGGPEKPMAFLKEIGVTHLPLYTDAKSEVFRSLKSIGRAMGLPTTLLIDEAGCEIGYLPGPADWASDDAKGLIEAALPKS